MGDQIVLCHQLFQDTMKYDQRQNLSSIDEGFREFSQNVMKKLDPSM